MAESMFLTPTPSPVRSNMILLPNAQNILPQMINPVNDLVYKDGNLIIISSDAHSTKTFQVYEGLMCQLSHIIQKKVEEAKRRLSQADPSTITLFSANAMSDPTNRDPEQNAFNSTKCTTIYVAEPPSAFGLFLRAIHDLSFFKDPPGHASMEAIRTILSISERYAVPELRQRALAHIYTLYPLTLQGWDNRRHKMTSKHRIKADLEDRLKLLAVICRIKDACWALPMLLYDICKFNISSIESHRLWGEVIPVPIKAKIRDGYTPQMELTKEVLSFILSSNPPECTSRELCLTARFEGAKSVVSWPLNDPLDVWCESDWEMFSDSVCQACIGRLREAYAEQRESAWSQIPRLFGCQAEGQEDEDGWVGLRHSLHSILGSVPLW